MSDNVWYSLLLLNSLYNVINIQFTRLPDVLLL